MSGLVNRGNAVRMVVLLVVACLAAALAQVVPSSSGGDVTTEAPRSVRQPVLPGPRLVPSATPRPVAVPRTAHRQAVRRDHHHHHRARHAAHRTRHSRHSRHAQARRALRKPPTRSWWRNHGGRDIGWPQCPPSASFRGRHGLGQPMPDPGVDFVVVGLTNGRAFTPNPCLGKHLRWVRAHHVHAAAYAFATYPTKGQIRRYRHRGPYDGRHLTGALRNAGVATAAYSIRVMRRHHFTTPHVWLDLEPSSTRPWSRHHDRNRAVVQGWVRGYRQAGYSVGFYSTTLLWRGIVGRMRLGLPEWRTAGPVSGRAARHKCNRDSIQGGRAVIAQWWTAHRDFDRLCARGSRRATLARFFHKW